MKALIIIAEGVEDSELLEQAHRRNLPRATDTRERGR